MTDNDAAVLRMGTITDARLALLALFLGVTPAASQPQTIQQQDSYISDSGRERTPAITAFPTYPSVARRDRLEGEATVCFTVNVKGQVIRPSIRRSSNKIFERPAMSAIRASTFEPLKPGEMKSNLKTCRIFRFKLAPIDELINEI